MWPEAQARMSKPMKAIAPPITSDCQTGRAATRKIAANKKPSGTRHLWNLFPTTDKTLIPWLFQILCQSAVKNEQKANCPNLLNNESPIASLTHFDCSGSPVYPIKQTFYLKTDQMDKHEEQNIEQLTFITALKSPLKRHGICQYFWKVLFLL